MDNFTYIACAFSEGARAYTYRTYLTFSIDEKALVQVGGTYKIVTVVAVDLATPPSGKIVYKHVVGKLITDISGKDSGKSATPDTHVHIDALDDGWDYPAEAYEALGDSDRSHGDK